VFARVAADAVVLLHFAFILFVLFGAAFVLRWNRMAWLHLPAVVWGACVEFFGWICPLTPIEQQLRELAGQQQYSEGFVEHYVVPVMYPAGLTPTIQLWLGIVVVAVNAALYAFVLLRWRGRRQPAVGRRIASDEPGRLPRRDEHR
jgi:uncharacterized protein DUF2784